MIRNNDPAAFLRTAKKAIGIMKQVRENADPAQKNAWNDSMYENRWKNFTWSVFFSVLMGGTVYAEFFIPSVRKFLTFTPWLITSIITSGLFLLGLIMVISYLGMILKKR